MVRRIVTSQAEAGLGRPIIGPARLRPTSRRGRVRRHDRRPRHYRHVRHRCRWRHRRHRCRRVHHRCHRRHRCRRVHHRCHRRHRCRHVHHRCRRRYPQRRSRRRSQRSRPCSRHRRDRWPTCRLRLRPRFHGRRPCFESDPQSSPTPMDRCWPSRPPWQQLQRPGSPQVQRPPNDCASLHRGRYGFRRRPAVTGRPHGPGVLQQPYGQRPLCCRMLWLCVPARHLGCWHSECEAKRLPRQC